MRAYSSMPTADFVAQLRDIAIKAGARPLVIYQLETLLDTETEIASAEADKLDAVNACEKETMEFAQKQLSEQVCDTLSWLEGLNGLSDAYYKQIADRLEAFKVEL